MRERERESERARERERARAREREREREREYETCDEMLQDVQIPVYVLNAGSSSGTSGTPRAKIYL